MIEKSDPEDVEELESLKEKRTRLEKIISHDGQELKDVQEKVKNKGTVFQSFRHNAFNRSRKV